MTLAWICLGLIAGTPDSNPAKPTDPAAYKEARSKAGRSPDDQVKLALWCEAHGLTAERLHHLSLAVLADPGNVVARGLMGLVSHQGRWRRPEAVAEAVKADPDRLGVLAEYEQKRQKAAYTADAQWTLGIWASEHGLPEQAKAHLTAVIRLDPSRDLAWKKLGYKKHDGRWVTDAQLAAEKAEADAQKVADKKWKPALEKFKGMLDRPNKHEQAEAALAEVTDPRAVPSILHSFATNRQEDQLRAVQLLGQVDSPAASRSLAGLAVLSKSAEVRRGALETLKGRDPRDFVQLWIALVRKPVNYEVRNVGGPGSPGSLLIEGERANLRRVYTPAGMPEPPTGNEVRLGYDVSGLPVATETVGMTTLAQNLIWLPNYSFDTTELTTLLGQVAHGGNPSNIAAHQAATGQPFARLVGYSPYFMTDQGLIPYYGPTSRQALNARRTVDLNVPIGQMQLEAQQSAQASREQLAKDVAILEKANAEVRRVNEPTTQALRTITGKDFGDDAEAWAKWWTDEQGYAFAITQATDRPTVVEEVASSYTPVTTPQIALGAVIPSHHSCFAAGTTVRTIAGDRKIETIRAGDLVLVQDTKSGALGYQAVLAAFHNPPNATFKIKLGDSDEVVATGIHRFWKVGKGWTMARDLKPGDLVRVLDGASKVTAVEADRVQPVFNLEVADGHSFLVGRLGALVHDNSLVEAVPTPFDAEPKAAK